MIAEVHFLKSSSLCKQLKYLEVFGAYEMWGCPLCGWQGCKDILFHSILSYWMLAKQRQSSVKMNAHCFAADLACSSFTETPTNSWALTLCSCPEFFFLLLKHLICLCWVFSVGQILQVNTTGTVVAKLWGWGAQGQAATQHGRNTERVLHDPLLWQAKGQL